MSNPNMKRGAIPTPRHKLSAANPFRPIKAAPPQFAVIPSQLSIWGNDSYGDCVTAEEAFAKAAYSIQCALPEEFVSQDDVIAWARSHGVLNGAGLTQVMDMMAQDGLPAGGKPYTDGPYHGVDYSNESVLQAAIAQGPVKIGIDANALPSGAGSNQGWYSVANGNHNNEDHCVGLCGYGQAGWLYTQLAAVFPSVSLPSGLDPATAGYLLFTWGTIGFVTHDWLMGTCQEAWLRLPTTNGQTPPNPNPPSVPPYLLFEGVTSVGAPAGYAALADAETAAHAIATQDKAAVAVKDSTGALVETVSPTPPAPTTFTVNVPQQPVFVHGPFGGTLHGYVPAFTVNGTVNPPAPSGDGVTLPPLVMLVLHLLCNEAPLLPEPYKTAVTALCSMLPAASKPCNC